MKALFFSEFGTPEDVINYKDCPLSEPKTGEVRIRMIFAPIHNHHLWYLRGRYGIKPNLPAISGDEAVGVIDKLGEGVHGLKVGQKVVACKMWGAWAEYFIASGNDIVPVPKNIPDEIAAQLLSMPLSSMMLLGVTGAKAGEWILQNAANGAVGKLVAGIASARNISVVNLVRSEQAKSDLAKFGIKNIISTQNTDWKNQVLKMTGGHKAVAGIDSLGGEASGEMLSLLKDGGTLISFGAQTQRPLVIAPADVIFYNKKVRGFWATRSAKELPPEVKMKILFNLLKALFLGQLTLAEGGGFNLQRLSKAFALKQLVKMMRAGKVILPVAKTYPLSEYKQAIAASEKEGKNGKILFYPS